MNVMSLTKISEMKRQRKKRSDAGSFILTARDLQMLEWIGEQFAIRFDHLQMLAVHFKDMDVDEMPKALSFSAAHQLTSRWVKEGLVERKKIFAEDPMWVWLTKKGLETVGLDMKFHTPAISKLKHNHAVNAVRLYAEKKLKDEIRWVSEREANALRKHQGKPHLVDGEIEFEDGLVVGIEVELTQKRKQRLRSILHHLKNEYETVWYFSSDEVFNVVQNAIEKIPSHEETFIQHRLYPIMNMGA